MENEAIARGSEPDGCPRLLAQRVQSMVRMNPVRRNLLVWTIAVVGSLVGMACSNQTGLRQRNSPDGALVSPDGTAGVAGGGGMGGAGATGGAGGEAGTGGNTVPTGGSSGGNQGGTSGTASAGGATSTINSRDCTNDSDCTQCPYVKAPSNSNECAGGLGCCGGQVMNTVACSANRTAWDTNCANQGYTVPVCPCVLPCTDNCPPTCRNGECGFW